MGYTRTRYRNVYRRGEVLYYRFRDEHGKWVERRYGIGQPRDARDAQEAAQARADAIRACIVDPRLEAMAEYAQRPLVDVIDDYVAYLLGKGTSVHHAEKCVGRFLKRWARECRVGRLVDANPTTLNRWLSEMPKAARTRNAYRKAVLALLKWAVDFGHVAYNPCPAGLIPSFNEAADRRRKSRALTAAELNAVLAVAPSPRREFYTVAAMMGLRWREIARLQWRNIFADESVLAMTADQTKNGRDAELPIPARVLEALASIRPEGAAGTDLVFPKGEPQLRTWKADLARAGVAWMDDRGRQADRKAMRTTFNSLLRQAGVSADDRQRLMRHADPRLTTNDDYSDIRLVDLRGRVEAASTAFQHEPPQGKEQERTPTPGSTGTRTA